LIIQSFSIMPDGRTKNGGARRGAGRKAEKDLHELQRVMEEACPYDERVDAFRVMLARAKSGDIGAMKLMFGYLYGTPVQRTEIAGADGNPIVIRNITAIHPTDTRPDADNE
jgi:hypothetical protein